MNVRMLSTFVALIIGVSVAVLAVVIGAVFVLLPKVEEKREQVIREDISERYGKAEDAFENCDLEKMYRVLDKLQQEYPDEASEIEQFVAEKLESLPIVDAGTLYSEYNSNSVKVDLNYANKLVVVQGKVSAIGKDLLGTAYIQLYDFDNAYSMIGVRCEFVCEEEITKIAELKEGDTVKVVGIYSDSSMLYPVLTKCYIID